MRGTVGVEALWQFGQELLGQPVGGEGFERLVVVGPPNDVLRLDRPEDPVASKSQHPTVLGLDEELGVDAHFLALLAKRDVLQADGVTGPDQTQHAQGNREPHGATPYDCSPFCFIHAAAWDRRASIAPSRPPGSGQPFGRSDSGP